MRIDLAPRLQLGKLTVSTAGDVLTINGEAFDFTGLNDGDTLEGVSCDWIFGPVSRELQITLMLPCGYDAPQERTFPRPNYQPRRWAHHLSGRRYRCGRFDQGTVVTSEQKQAMALAALEALYAGAIQSHMDAFARSKKYDSIHTGASHPQYAAEGEAMRNWRSLASGVYANAEMERVVTGQRPQPTVEELLQDLPKIVWP